MAGTAPTYTPHPSASTLAEILDRRAAERPEKPVYTFLLDGEVESDRLSYAELAARARALAAELGGRVAPGERVLLLFPPGLELAVAFFACLYCGAVAVPAYPPRSRRALPRLAAMVEDCRPALGLASAAVLARSRAWFEGDLELAPIAWLTLEEAAATAPSTWRPPAVDPGALAFLQYTSGSTAAPKGVMVTHANLLANQELIGRAFERHAGSVLVSWLPLYHDMGLIGNLLHTPFLGAHCVWMSPMAFLKRPARWLEAISRYQATTSGAPNFAYELAVARVPAEERARLDLSRWEVAFNGAEPVRAGTLERFAEAFAPAGFRREAFRPCYGLAEATLLVSGGGVGTPPVVRRFDARGLAAHRADSVSDGDPSSRDLVGSGPVLAGTRVEIVDPATGLRLPPGEVGEIWVAGASVAAGYWQQPEQTVATFGARLADDAGAGTFLRTGDLGFLDSGELFITGRLKDLLIVRGRNVYPQDLELAAERSHPALAAGGAAAFAVERGGNEELVLVAETGGLGDESPEAVVAAVRRALAEEHEVHAAEVVLIRAGTLPRTTSGKVQRRQCRELHLEGGLHVVAASVARQPPPAAEPELARDALAAAGGEARRKLVTDFLAAKLARLLHTRPEDLAPDTVLATAGLDSLSAVEVRHQVESSLGVELPLEDLLSGATLGDMVEAALARLDTPVAVAEEAARLAVYLAEPGIYPVSYGQRALWFLDRLAPATSAYHLSGAAHVSGALDREALSRAVLGLVARHPALRTTFRQEPGREPEQVVWEALPPEVRFEELPAEAAPGAVTECLLDAAERSFDLERGPLLRVLVLAEPGGSHLLLLATHHIVTDLWSLAVMLEELGALYAGRGPEELPEPGGTPAGHAAAERALLAGARGAELWEHWRRELGGEREPLALPTDRPRPPAQSFRGAAVSRALAAPLAARLQALARERGTTLFVSLAAALQALLGRWSGQRELAVGVPTSGRASADLAGAVGYFVNPVVLAADLGGNPTAGEWIERVRTRAATAFAHQDAPFPWLAERLAPVRDPSRSPLFDVLFALERAPRHEASGIGLFALGEAGGRMALGDLTLESLPLPQRSAQFDLAWMVAEAGETLASRLIFNTDLFDRATAERFAAQLEALLLALAEAPDRPLASLALLASADRHQLLCEWNDTAREPSAGTLHGLIEAQAQRTPERIAVSWSGEQWSYAGLDARASRLAARLRSLGIAPETPVGVLLERSATLPAALLAVLKAGGAYVPLDPNYPAERLTFLVEDSGLTTVIAEPEHAEKLPPASFRLLSPSSVGGSTGHSDESTPVAWRVAPHGGPREDRSASEDRSGESCGDRTRQEQPTPGHASALLSGTSLDTAASTASTASTISAANLAYLIYTSGSTGRPKGIAIEHRSAVALVAWATEAFTPAELAGVAASTSVNFDLSVFELFVPLALGGTVIGAQNGLAVAELSEAAALTLVNTVPSVAERLAEGWLPAGLRTVNLAGEPLKPELAARLHRHPQVERLLNLYGPSEDTTYSTFTAVDRGARRVTIGRPVSGSAAYLLDRRLAPVPLGVPAELCLAGDGLARGYLGRPALTAEKWVPDPFSGRGGRLYATGDLARLLPSGEIDFLGRIDHQIKLRGFRIELGEIEARLVEQPGVRAATVLLRQDLATGPALVAYLEAEREPLTLTLSPRAGRGDRSPGLPGGAEAGSLPASSLREDAEPGSPPAPSPRGSGERAGVRGSELRDALRERLPEPMVPSFFVVLAALPLTPNGKVDRRALARLPAPQPEGEAGGGAHEPPRGSVEEAVAAAWADLLGLAEVGRHQSFFELGGHSILATQVISRLRHAFGVELPVRALFERPTVAGLAETLEAALARHGRTATAPVRPLADRGALPLSAGQERLWFLEQWQPGTAAYNMPVAARLRGRLDIAALAEALAAIAARHEGLRASFAAGDGAPVLSIAPPSPARLPVVDLAGLGAPAREAAAQKLGRSEAARPFDLERGPLFRAAALRLGEGEHFLLLALHHIVADGWSIGVLLAELGALYRARLAGEAAELPPLPVQYADYAAWQRRQIAGEALAAGLAFWRERLAGAPEKLELPLDRPRPAVPSLAGGQVRFRLPAELRARLATVGSEAGSTPFMTVLAGFATLLHRVTGQRDLVLGAPVAQRPDPALEGLIGFFVGNLVLRVDLAGDPGFRALLARCRATVLEAQAHEIPFEHLVEALNPGRGGGHAPLFQVALAWQAQPLAMALPGLAVEPLPMHSGTAKLDLALSFLDLGDGGATAAPGGLWADLEYASDLFDRTSAERLAAQLIRLLDAVAREPERPLSTLPLLSAAEAHQLGHEWGRRRGTAFRPYPGQPDLPPQPESTRPGPSLRSGRQGSLASRRRGAGARGCGLRRRAPELRRAAGPGVGCSQRGSRRSAWRPEGVVALLAPRSAELVVGMLAALEAGASFLPLDPGHPPERLAAVVQDAGAAVLLTGQGQPAGWSPAVLVLTLEPLTLTLSPQAGRGDREESFEMGGVRNGVRGSFSADARAYVIYTSGSTGRPKGVEVRHRGLANLVAWHLATYGLTAEDRTSLVASPAFDASVWEVFPALAAGSRLEIPDEDVRADPARLAPWLVERRITLSFQPTPVAELLAARHWPSETVLRALLTGGDRLQAAPAAALPFRLLNHYGPTEVTVVTTAGEVAPRPAAAVSKAPSIGRPIAGLSLLVVDRSFAPLPVGVPGELLIGGAGLARGYLGRPALTAQSFVPDPRGAEPGARLYRSGDLVRWAAAGEIDFLGRIDTQVKVRGFRIEPGEIEAALAALPAVAQAAVLARDAPGGGKALVAYVVLHESVAQADAAETLRDALAARLPSYMVPSRFVVLACPAADAERQGGPACTA